MNFYPHHIGDYLTATAHLTWVEDCAYRRLLDLYYSREQAIPADLVQASRLCRAATKEERKAVETVLAEFFTLTDAGWTHSRCEQEIVKAADAAERARANGKKGGRPPKAQPKTNPEETQPVNSRNPEKSKSQAPITNPITNTSEAKASGAEAPPKSPDELTKDELWSAGKSLLEQAGMPAKQCGTFVGRLVKDYDAETVIEAVRVAVVERPADPASFLKAVCQQIAGERKPAQPISFADHDEMKRRRRWEEMTGRKWPADGEVIDITPDQQRITA